MSRTAARRPPTRPTTSAFVWLVSCGLLALPPAAATAQDDGPTDLARVTTSLERQIEKILDETGIPSISLALIRDGEVVWASAHGYANVGARVPATTDTYYSTGSTFKFVTATAIMQLVERGDLTLDTPLNEIVGPELAVEGADDVTVRHLLSHHSGLDAFEFARRINTEGPVTTVPLWSRRAHITPEEVLSHTRRTGPPGTEFEYSNDGYIIAGYIVEKVSGQSYDKYVAEHVLQPLGVDIDRPSVPSPAVVEHMALPYELSDNAPTPIFQVRFDAAAPGDVYLKASDMARFVAAQLNGGEFQGGRILSSTSTEEMRRQQFDGQAYGLGVQLASFRGHDIINHSGGIPGFKSRMVAEPSTRQGVYIMANAGNASALGPLASYAMQLMWGDDVEPLPSFATKTEVTVSPDIFDEYAGEYALTPDLSITVSRVRDRFFVQPTGQSRVEVFASSETDFFLRGKMASFTFGRDEEGGPVTHLILHQNGDQRANRVTLADLVPSAEDITQFSGTYVLQGANLEVRIFEQDGYLFMQPNGRSAARLLYQGQGEFRASGDPSVRIIFDPESGRDFAFHQDGAQVKGIRQSDA